MKRRRFNSSDTDGVLELPYRIMITVIVMALVLPTVLDSFSTIEEKHAEAELKAECRYLVECISAIYSQGEGSTKVVQLNLPEKTALVSAGCNLEVGPRNDMITVRYKVAGGQEQRMPVKSGNNYVSMCSDDSTVFILNKGGEHRVHLKKCRIVADLNGDGLAPDFYIELSRGG